MDEKESLHRHLRGIRDVMPWKLEGLSDADIRRPMTRSGTNLLGLVKHITGGEISYLGEAFGRPATDVRLPWWEPENAQKTIETSGDMYAAPGESTEYIVDLYRRACAHSDQTIADLDLDDIGTVPHSVLFETVSWFGPMGRRSLSGRHSWAGSKEASRHAGHADIVRELIDGSIGGARDQPLRSRSGR